MSGNGQLKLATFIFRDEGDKGLAGHHGIESIYHSSHVFPGEPGSVVWKLVVMLEDLQAALGG